MLHEELQAVSAPSNKMPTQRRTTLVVFLVVLIAVLALTLGMVLPYLLSVLMGGILALLSQPVFQWLKRHHFRPRVASTVVTLGVVLLVIAPISLFVSKAVQQGIAIAKGFSEEGLSFQALVDRVSGWGLIERIIGSPVAFEQQVHRWVQSAASSMSAAILGVAAHLPNLILQLALASLACFFLLVDGKRFRLWVADKIPMDADVRAKVVGSFKNTASSVIWATLAAAAAQGAVIWIAYLVLRVPAAFLAAGATFIFAWIPIVGSTPVWVVGALYLYLQGMGWKAALMIAFGLVTGLVDNFVRPLVLKGRSNLHPLVSLVAIFGGIRMFGIMGIFVGPILAAVLISLLQTWPVVGARFGLLSGANSEAPNIGETAVKNDTGKAA